MNKMILIIAFFTMPFFGLSQTTDANDAPVVISTEVVKELILNENDLSARKVEPISSNPKVQNKIINFKKSNDLISIEAYIRNLQLKRKETLMS